MSPNLFLEVHFSDTHLKQAGEALRLYRRREKIDDLFNVQKNSLDGRRPRTWYPDNLKGRLFCQFVALGYHCFLMKRIGEVQEQLERDTEGKTQEELQLEKNLKRWIKEHSLIQILEWFDCVETTTVQTPRGKVRWSTESIKRDQLFLKLLGVTPLLTLDTLGGVSKRLGVKLPYRAMP